MVQLKDNTSDQHCGDSVRH